MNDKVRVLIIGNDVIGVFSSQEAIDKFLSVEVEMWSDEDEMSIPFDTTKFYENRGNRVYVANAKDYFHQGEDSVKVKECILNLCV